MLTPQPHKWELKPGSATFPFFGVQPCLMDPSTLDDEGHGEPGVAPVEMEGNGVSGHLCVKAPWPGMMRGLWGDDGKERYEKVYFSQFDGYYCAGDGSTRDEDGYYWVTGRTDDVLIVSGHNIGTAEVESACVLHESVAEAAVVGFPHEVKGNAIHAYITLNDGALASRPFASALSVLRSAWGRRGGHGRAQEGAGRLGHGIRGAICYRGTDPVGTGAAQDPVGQDHAPNSSQDRRPGRVHNPAVGRPERLGRHVDARGAGCGG